MMERECSWNINVIGVDLLRLIKGMDFYELGISVDVLGKTCIPVYECPK